MTAPHVQVEFAEQLLVADLQALPDEGRAVLAGFEDEHDRAHHEIERRPIGLRNVGMAAEFYRDHQKRDDDLAFIEDDSTTGAEVRRRMGEADAHAYEVAGRFDLNWRGLARYWRKKS